MASLKTALIAAKAEFKAFINATLGDVITSISEAFTAHGLLLTQPIVFEGGVTVLKTIVALKGSKETLESSILLNVPTDPQQLGSLLAYYRYYLLTSLLGIDSTNDSESIAIPIDIDVSVPSDEDEKARKLHDTMKSANIQVHDLLDFSKDMFNTSNIRSLSWEQINRLIEKMNKVRGFRS